VPLARGTSRREVARPFVGRERELHEIDAAFEEVGAGRGRFILISGEPGIGKTRLAEEIAAARAPRHHFRALWAWCREGEGAPAFWPWIQLLRKLLRGRDASAFVTRLGASAAYLAQLAPEIRELVPHLADAPTNADSVHARFYVFDTVASLLRRVADAQPVVLVLDDLQWAGAPSLRLLEFLARDLADARLLIVGTAREGDASRGGESGASLAALEPLAHPIRLGGLSRDEIAVFIEQTARVQAPDPIVTSVHHATNGNAFLVDELVRLLVAENRLASPSPIGTAGLSVSERARALVHQRLLGVSAECREILGVAAVIGQRFDLATLADVCTQERDEVLALLDEAGRARLVVADASAPGQLDFSHDLLWEVLYGDLSYGRRVELHRRVGESIERRYGPDDDDHSEELLHHFSRATLAGEAERVARYGARAGKRALAHVAYERATAHLLTALEALEIVGPADRRCGELRIALGDACWRLGDRQQAREHLRLAAELARRSDDPELLARAALGLGGRSDVVTSATDEVVAVLEETLARLPPVATPLRARVLARLAMALYFSRQVERRIALSGEAVEIARRLDDRATLAYALLARHFALWGPDHVEERLGVASEILELSRRGGDREAAAWGTFWRMCDLLELGDTAAADEECQAFRRVSEELRQTHSLWLAAYLKATWALFTGQLAEAEPLIEQAYALGAQAQSPNALMVFAIQTFELRNLQGRLAELESVIRASVVQYPEIPAYRTGLALLFTEIGRESDARAEFERAAVNDFAAFPRDAAWMNAMGEAARVAAHLRDAPRAAALYAKLEPYAARSIVVPFAAACEGSISHSLGLLAATLGRADEAVSRYQHALEANLGMGARPWAAFTRYRYAETLLARSRGGDRERGIALLAEACREARDMEMPALAAAAERVASEAESSVGIAAAATVRGDDTAGALARASGAAGPSIFRREGEYWVVALNGRTARMRDARGLAHIARLLRDGGREVHVLELAAAGGEGGAHERTDAGDAGAVLDERAKREYRRRLAELRQDLEESTHHQDLGRTERLRMELESLEGQLAQALGLGGRDRRAAGMSERARVSVTKAIRAAIERIRREEPVLGHHLATCIRTGIFCSYTPPPGAPIDWRL